MPRDRNSQIRRVLGIIRDMTETPDGVLINDLSEKYGVNRRTIERDMIVLEKAGYKIETLNDEENPLKVRKKIVIEKQSASFPINQEEIASARAAQKALSLEANQVVSCTFAMLVDRLEQHQKTRVRVDGEGLSEKQAFVMKPNFSSLVNADIMQKLQASILDTRVIRLKYRKSGIGTAKEYLAEPYGILFGAKNYLVWRGCDDKKYRLFALPYIEKVEIIDERYKPDPKFDLERFAETSFGIYNAKPIDVELLITPKGRARLDGFSFHPSQTIKSNPDGSATVRFSASGIDELC